MDDDRVLMMSMSKALEGADHDGKGLHWTCNVDDELPIKMRQNGPGSEMPTTLCDLFTDAVRKGGNSPALWVERDNKKICWTWDEYW